MSPYLLLCTPVVAVNLVMTEVGIPIMVASLLSRLRIGRTALLFVVVAYLTQGRASAECGDYVTVVNGPTASAHQTTPQEQAPAKPPCHGPNCSGSPVHEPSPLAPVVPAGSQAKELTQHPGTASASDASPGSALDRESTSARPIRHASAVFHPPR